MKTTTRYGVFVLLFLLFSVPGVFAAQFYDVNPFSMTTANTDTVAFGMRFRINSTIPMNLTGSIRDSGSTPTHALFYNGTPAWSGAQSFCPTGSLANVSFSGDVATIPGGIRVNPNETWTICTTANGASRSAQYSGAVTGNTTGNSTLIIYDCSLYAACQTTNWFEQQGVTIANASSTVPVINIITVNLSNAVNGSSWVNTTTFSNVTGTLTFTYFNITKDGFCVTYTGNGTGTNCTAGNGASTYFNVTNTTSITGTQVVIASTYQALLNISAYKLFLNTTIATFNTTNNAFKNVSGSIVYALNGSNNLQIDVAGNYTKNITCTITTPLTTGQCNATGIYDNQYTIGAKNSNVGISNFTINVTNSTLGGLLYRQNTTNGSIVFSLLQGYQYLFAIEPTGFAYDNISLPANASTHLYNFSVFQRNTLNVTFFDEENSSTVVGPNITLQLVSTPQSGVYTTTNGTIITDILTPAAYHVTYSSPNYTTRNYEFTLTNNTYLSLRLPMLLSSSSTTVTVTVVDNTGTLLENATVKAYLYNINTNSYSVNQIFTTNNEGIGIITVQLSTETYYFTVDYLGSTRLVTTPSVIYGNTLQLTIPLNVPGFSRLFDNNHLTGVITNSTPTLYNFLWTDEDNVATSGCLYAYQFTPNQLTLYNSTCASSSSGTVGVGLNGNNNQTYYLYGVVTKNDETYTLDTRIVTFAASPPTESTTKLWLFVMLMIMILLIIFFLDSPAIMVVSAGLVLLLFSAAHLIPIEVGYTIPLFIICVIIAVIIGL